MFIDIGGSRSLNTEQIVLVGGVIKSAYQYEKELYRIYVAGSEEPYEVREISLPRAELMSMLKPEPKPKPKIEIYKPTHRRGKLV